MSWTGTVVGMVGERTPIDLGVVAAWAVLAAAWAVTVGDGVQSVTAVLAAPLVFVFPGYVFVAMLFPESAGSEADGPNGTGGTKQTGGSKRADGSKGLTLLERGVLSVFASLFVVPLAALVTNFTPWGVGPATILFAVSLVTLAGTGVAYVRRVGVVRDRRLGPVAGDLQAAVERSLRNPTGTVSRAIAGNSTFATALNVVVVVVVVAAVGSIAQAVVIDAGPGYTDAYLLTENESGGLVAADYPTNLTSGEATPLTVGVENHHSRSVEYTVLVRLQRVNASGSSNAVTESQSIAEFDRRLAPGERALIDHSVTPELTGERLRLVYLVYAGEPPSEPSTANADAEVHLWVTVASPASGTDALECAKGCS